MSWHICLGELFILVSRLAIFLKKLSFWLSACSVLIVVPIRKVHPSFPLVSWNGRCLVIIRFLIIEFLSVPP